ncbi:uncharacterized protein LOC109816552 [Cajanus cajan]|nr:uncharacterized protein LOC109816552 [Cajanus cajan]
MTRVKHTRASRKPDQGFGKVRLESFNQRQSQIIQVFIPDSYSIIDDVSGSRVKEDLDEIKQTLTRQFWGMASFLAPPPSNSQSDPSLFVSDQSNHRSISQPQLDDAAAISDHSSDAEQGNDPESNSVSFRSDSKGNCGFELRAVGITEEVLAFAMNIAMHPETWLDFPIEEEDDTDDFDMSDAQQEHAAVVERLTPRLVALRIELCPCHMSESYFWKVYFVLLHSRLNKEDAEILSTPQVCYIGFWLFRNSCNHPIV